ncbi:MAG: transcriptional repressor [Campylobacteraceae bacterium]|jgi:Fur family ferric uptake transcriptional regulator|nr:transcriptional repressor [Campylobacteraceae bacterium]
MKKLENIEYDSLLANFKDILKKNGLKFTIQREVILRTLYSINGHFTPDALYLIIKEKYPDLNVGIATVYRTLNVLEESDVATSLSFGSQGKKFELGNKPHHDHMICKICNTIIEFEDKAIEKRQEQIAKERGFKLTGHLMQLYGICSKCQKTETGE